MARPETEIIIHRFFLEGNAAAVKEAIHLLTHKSSLNVEDIQVVRILTNVYESLISPTRDEIEEAVNKFIHSQ